MTCEQGRVFAGDMQPRQEAIVVDTAQEFRPTWAHKALERQHEEQQIELTKGMRGVDRDVREEHAARDIGLNIILSEN